jgi:parallel beta-helix repeat protein
MVVSGAEGIILSGNGGNNSVVRNNIEGNEFYGVNLISTSNNLVESNNVSNCSWHGIILWMSSCNNVIRGNNVTGCKVGIEVSYSSNNNTVSNNRFSMNRVVGVVIGFRIPESGPEWGGAADNYIIENSVTDNNLGIELIYSKNNTVFHNNVEENNSSVAIIGSYFNIWDDGAIGNYWSDYLGTDANHDGIGDTPYVIDANNADHYPLMARALNKQDETPPITTHDYNNLWKNRDFTILLSATDDLSGVAETHYRINNGIAKSISSDGQPTITIENGNNTLEYWSVDRDENEETPHKILAGIKLDKSSPKASIDGTQSAKVGTTLSFDAGNSTDNMGIASCYWSLGDGRTGTGSSIDHSYDNSGVYEVTLMVRDMANNTDTVSMTVTVTSEGFSLLGLDLIQIAGIVVASIVAVVAVACVLLKRRR